MSYPQEIKKKKIWQYLNNEVYGESSLGEVILCCGVCGTFISTLGLILLIIITILSGESFEGQVVLIKYLLFIDYLSLVIPLQHYLFHYLKIRKSLGDE